MRSIGLFSLLMVLILSGCNAQPAKPAAPAPDYKPTFPIEEVMGHIIMPNADLLWGSVATNVTAKGVEEIVPKEVVDVSMKHVLTRRQCIVGLARTGAFGGEVRVIRSIGPSERSRRTVEDVARCGHPLLPRTFGDPGDVDTAPQTKNPVRLRQSFARSRLLTVGCFGGILHLKIHLLDLRRSPGQQRNSFKVVKAVPGKVDRSRLKSAIVGMADLEPEAARNLQAESPSVVRRSFHSRPAVGNRPDRGARHGLSSRVCHMPDEGGRG